MFEWRFRRMQPGEMNVDPIEAEFFSTASLDSLTDALVRESIQNSLDARRPGERLTMRFSFPAAAAVTDRWFGGLWPHLKASRSGIAQVPDERAPLPFVLVEDFGTRGLEGEPAQSEDEALDEDGPRNDFYYFWRNIGRSRKSASDLGRWGLGKTVFPAASGINAFLAVTTRASDRRTLLMGQSVLRIHRLDGARYYPYGYFGRFDEGFAHPVEEQGVLARLCSDFELSRTTEPGLSVIVPWPDPDITPDRVLGSIVRHYFVPVLTGDLEVEVADPRSVRRVDASTLTTLLGSSTSGLRRGEGAALERLVALTRFGQRLPRAELTRIAEPPADGAPRWAPDCLDRAPSAVRSRFEAGLPVAFSVPVWVKPTGADSVLSEIDVYLERDDALSRGEEHFVRDGITVAGVRGGVPRGVRAVTIARDAPIAALLGDSENPAHTEWQERSPKFKDRYRHGPFTLRYVRNAPRELARALTRPAAGRHERLLQHLFSLPNEETVLETTRQEAGRPGEGPSTTMPVEVGEPKPASVQLQKTEQGFRLIGSGAGPTPSHLVVKVAYEVRRGDPFARYQPPDFDLASTPITIDAQGLVVEQVRQNAMVLRVEEARFCLDVEGFDPHRDVRVRVAAEEVRR